VIGEVSAAKSLVDALPRGTSVLAILYEQKTHRDVLVTSAVGWRWGVSRALPVQPVGGFSVVRSRTVTDFYTEALNRSGTIDVRDGHGPPVEDWNWALTSGVDLAVPLADRFAITSTVRLHVIHENRYRNEQRLGSRSWRVGLGAWVTF
jgi:hypothetical protein